MTAITSAARARGTSARTPGRGFVPPSVPSAQRQQSSAGPHASSTSCSRTIPVSALTAPSAIMPGDRPRRAHAQPDADQECDRKRRAGMGHGRRHVHIEEERRAEPDGGRRRGRVEAQRAGPPRSTAATRGTHTPPSRSRPPRCTASSSRRSRRCDPGMQHTCGQVSDGVERRPQDGAPDRAEIDPLSSLGFALEQRFVEPGVPHGPAVVEVLVFVLERQVVVEPERSQERVVLHFVRRVDSRGDGGKRQREQGDQQPHGPRRTGEAHSVPVLSPVTRASGTSRPARG